MIIINYFVKRESETDYYLNKLPEVNGEKYIQKALTGGTEKVIIVTPILGENVEKNKEPTNNFHQRKLKIQNIDDKAL